MDVFLAETSEMSVLDFKGSLSRKLRAKTFQFLPQTRSLSISPDPNFETTHGTKYAQKISDRLDNVNIGEKKF
jgi:hypothetical protein